MSRTLVRLMIGLWLVLPLTAPAMATPASAQEGQRLGVPPPEECTGEPATAGQIVAALRGEGVSIEADPIPLIGIDERDLPVGTEPDPADVAAASEVIWAATACANAGDFARFFGHLTPNAIHALVMGLLEALGRPAAPFTEEELADLQASLEIGLVADPQALVGDERARIDAIRGARLLPDGRLLLLSDGRLVLDGTGYLIMVQIDGVWKADRLGQIGDVDMLGLGSGLTVPPSPVGDASTAGGDPRDGGQDSNGAMTALDAIRMLVYHELTSWETSPNTYGEEAPILSDDGRTIAFARAPGTGDPGTPNRIFVMSAEGTNEREVDAYPTLCYCGSMIDLSGDGSLVVSSDSVQLRVAGTDGSGARELLVLASNEINAARISGDGSTVVFRVYRDTSVRETGALVPAGFYAIDSDGSNMRLLAGRDELAALFDVPREGFPTAGPPHALDVSHDGRRVVASVMVEPIDGGYHQSLILIDAAGGVSALTDIVAFVTNVAISSDGATAAYVLVHQETNIAEAGAIDLASGERRVLTNSSAEPPGINQGLTGGLERIQLSASGAFLLLGGTGLLIDTRDGRMLALSVADGAFFSGDPPQLASGRMELATMSADATRFLYLSLAATGVHQAVRLDLNPASTGDAPTLREVTIDRPTIGIDRDGLATVTVAASTSNEFLRVGVAVLREGRPDANVSRYGLVLSDDGATSGDVTAGDGIYTVNDLSADCCALPGPRIVRVKAETIDANGRRHATAVDTGGLSVTA